jgi:ParB/RepB/Spo0J family partition protein
MTATETTPRTARIVMLPVDQLTLGLDFRLDEDTSDLADLAMSVAELGVLQPLVVRQVADGWEVIAGRRRLAAARLADIDTVPCILRDLTDNEAADVALAENLHRRDLSPVEVAPPPEGFSADVITHWRRRHDRLVAGLQRMRRARADGMSLTAVLLMVERLLELDAKPLDNEGPVTS